MSYQFNVYDIEWGDDLDMDDQIEIDLPDSIVDSSPLSSSSESIMIWEAQFEAAVVNAVFQRTGHRPIDFSFEQI